MIEHVHSYHKFGSSWKCRKCCRVFEKGYELLSHNYYEHVPGKYQCSVEGCNFIVSFKSKIYSHFFTHYEKDGSLKEGLVIRPEAIKPSSERKREDEWQPKSNGKKLEKGVTLEENQHKFTISTLLCPVKHCDFECFYKDENYEFQKHLLDTHSIKFYPCSAPNCNESFDYR